MVELFDCHFQHINLIIILEMSQLRLKLLILDHNRIVFTLEMLVLLFNLTFCIVGSGYLATAGIEFKVD